MYTNISLLLSCSVFTWDRQVDFAGPIVGVEGDDGQEGGEAGKVSGEWCAHGQQGIREGSGALAENRTGAAGGRACTIGRQNKAGREERVYGVGCTGGRSEA